MVNPSSTRRIGRVLGACCLMLPLACSAASNDSAQIDKSDAVGGAPATASGGSSPGSGSGGMMGAAAAPATDPGGSSTGGVLITGDLGMRPSTSEGCTQD